jgi:hypothetical protein
LIDATGATSARRGLTKDPVRLPQLFEPSSQVSHHLIVGHGATGRDIFFARVDFLEELLGRHDGILSQRSQNWYPLIEEYRNAVRTFPASLPPPPPEASPTPEFTVIQRTGECDGHGGQGYPFQRENLKEEK